MTILPRGIHWKATTRIGVWLMRRAGHRIGQNVRLLGMPEVEGPGRIVIGDRVALTSDRRGTALGTRGPLILKTLHHDTILSIGDDTGISGGVICAAGRIEIGRRCLLGSEVMVFDTDFHPLEPDGRRYARPDFATFHRPTIIEDNVFIGTRSIIGKGVRIGSGSVVGAGSVVTSDIPPGVIAAGAPARVIRPIESAGNPLG